MAVDNVARAMAAHADSKAVTAYQYAVAGGYTGTEAQFTEDLGELGNNAQAVNNAVRYDEAQSKTDAQKLQAQANLGLDTSEGSLQEQLDNKAGIDDYCAGLTAGQAENFVPSEPVIDTDPYNYRTTAGNEEVNGLRLKDIVGGTLAVNQLVDKTKLAASGTNNEVAFTNNGDGSFTINGTANGLANFVVSTDANTKFIIGHTYILGNFNSGDAHIYLADTDSNVNVYNGYAIYKATANTSLASALRFRITDGYTANNLKVYVMLLDLTTLFGTILQTVGSNSYNSIADYLYALTGTQGIEWLYKYFPILNGGYISFANPSLASVCADRRIANNVQLWDEVPELGTFSAITGINADSTNTIRNKNLIRVIPNTKYAIYKPAKAMFAVFLGQDGTPIQYVAESGDDATVYGISASLGSANENIIFTAPSGAYFMKIREDGVNTYSHDITIGLYYGTPLTYVAYDPTTYSLGHDTLRGIYMLDSFGNLYLDRTKNDIKTPDGTITRKINRVHLKDLTWNSTGISGLFWASLSNMINTANVDFNVKSICDSYTQVGGNGSTLYNGTHDKKYCFNGQFITSTFPCICLRDSSIATIDPTTFKNALEGKYLEYEILTPTTESGTSFPELQKADNLSTEEIVDYEYEQGNRAFPLPVGTYSEYAPDYRSKVEEMPAVPLSDGDYLVRVANGKAEYVKFASQFPDTPNSVGTFSLKLTTTQSGDDIVGTMAWVADEA